MSAQANAIVEARFSPKLKVYFWSGGALTLLVTVVGIVLLPLWAIVGGWWASRYYASLSCRLTERSVVVGKGVFFKQELTIPLDKIQDISIREGPLLGALGLLSLRIETAGQRSATTGQSEADLIGLMDARRVRDQILEQRDRLEARGFAAPAAVAPVQAAGGAADGSQAVLREIRDALLRIEARLGERDRA